MDTWWGSAGWNKVGRNPARYGGNDIAKPAGRPSVPLHSLPLAVFRPSFSRSHYNLPPYQTIIPPIVRRSGILSHTLRPPRLAGVATCLLVTFVGPSNTCVQKRDRYPSTIPPDRPIAKSIVSTRYRNGIFTCLVAGDSSIGG